MRGMESKKAAMSASTTWTLPPVDLLPDRLQGLVGRASGSEAVGAFEEVGLEDRLQDELGRRLGHPVPDGGDPQVAELAVGLGDGDPPHRLGLVAVHQQVLLDLSEEGLDPLGAFGLDVFDGDAVDARGAVIPQHLLPCAVEHVGSVDPVVESVEASVRRHLGRLVELGLELLGLVASVVCLWVCAHRSLPTKTRCTVGALSSGRVVLSRPSAVLRPHLRPAGHRATSPWWLIRPIPFRGSRPGAGVGFPQFPHPPSDHSDPHTPGGSWAPAVSRSSALSVAFAVTKAARLPLVPCGAITTGLQDSLGIVTDWSVAPPKGLSTLGFDARGFHPTPPACYGASWQLPRPDSHRLVGAFLCVGHLGGITSPGAHVAGHDLTESAPR